MSPVIAGGLDPSEVSGEVFSTGMKRVGNTTTRREVIAIKMAEQWKHCVQKRRSQD